MDRSSSSWASEGDGDAPHTSNATLHGHWLVLARIGWLAVAALEMIIFVLSLPIAFVQAEQVCTGSACGQNLTAQDIEVLAKLGLSPAFFAGYFAVIIIVFALVWTVVGVLIFWRKSNEPRMLFVALFLVSFGIIFPNDPRTTLAAVHSAWWLPVAAVSFLSATCFTLFFYLFPDGRFVPRWTRWLLVALILVFVPTYFFPDSPLSMDHWPSALNSIYFLVVFGSVIFVQVYRYRRHSTPVQRQQTKWVMLAIVTSLLIASLPSIFGQSNGLLYKFIGSTLLYLALLLIPIAIAIAILRYRLWDVDALINKALVYGLLTGLLAAVYVGLILGLGSLIGLITGQASQPVAIIISTLVIAALFQPVRRRIQAIIDRRFYRRKYNAEKTLAAFSATLRQEVDLEELRAHIIAVVQETMQPAHVSLWLRPPEHDGTHRAPWRSTPPASSDGR